MNQKEKLTTAIDKYRQAHQDVEIAKLMVATVTADVSKHEVLQLEAREELIRVCRSLGYTERPFVYKKKSYLATQRAEQNGALFILVEKPFDTEMLD